SSTPSTTAPPSTSITTGPRANPKPNPPSSKSSTTSCSRGPMKSKRPPASRIAASLQRSSATSSTWSPKNGSPVSPTTFPHPTAARTTSASSPAASPQHLSSNRRRSVPAPASFDY